MNWNRNNIKKIRMILLDIINNSGECLGFSIAGTCTECPFSYAAQREDGSYVSCLEYVVGVNYPWKVNTIGLDLKVNQLYLEKAERLLLDIDAENVLLKGE